jgi:predicted ArsR family transcriptional regulator
LFLPILVTKKLTKSNPLPSIGLVVASIANILKPKRSEILRCLKARGRVAVDEIASAVGGSRVGIRRHLELLSRDGLVSFEVVRRERGRPSHLYFLTDKAELLFPTSYDAFALDLISTVNGLFGNHAVTRVIRAQAHALASTFKPALRELDFDERVKKLASLVDERGYNVAVRRMRDGSYSWKQRNCPLITVANVYCQVCDEELRLYNKLLGAQVVRECRMSAGARSCDFKILNPTESRPASLVELRGRHSVDSRDDAKAWSADIES